MKRVAIAVFCAASILPVAFTGCALTSTATPLPQTGSAIRGSIHGGQQPIVGARVYLLAAATSGYGSASVSLLDPSSTGLSDSIGAYVVTDGGGGFDISGEYSCTPGTQVYMYGSGGDPGAGVNTAVGLAAILGNCPASGTFAQAVPYLSINEVSTVAAAYAIAGFATDSTHVASSGTKLATSGLANAFANSANIVDLPSGSALVTTPGGNGAVPTATINTLANIIAACINSTDAQSYPCTTLFANATGTGGSVPTDTMSAIVNVAHNPGANVAALYDLPSPASPYAPTLTTQPNDFTIAVTFTGGGLGGPGPVTIDSTGSVWVANYYTNTATKFSPLGVPASGSPFSDPSFNGPYGVAIDRADNAWIINVLGNSVTVLAPTGSAVAGSPFTGGGISQPAAIAIDGSDDVWIANYSPSSVTKLSHSGTPAPGSPFSQSGTVTPFAIAIDPAGNAWVPNYDSNNVSVFTRSGVPAAVSPISGGGLDTPSAVAIDHSGNAWIANFMTGTATELLSSGALAAPSAFTGGGLVNAQNVAIDGDGNAWFANYTSLTELSQAGTALTPASGLIADPTLTIDGLAVDSSGNVWFPTFASNAIVEVIGLAAPVVTPLSVGVKTDTLGVRP